MSHTSFHPPERTLMGPGPSDVPARVLEALARPTIGHLDPAFVGMMDEVKALLQYAFRTENDVTFPVSGPGTAGMETCFTNLVEPGDEIVVCVNGVFGGRMKENVERCGGTAVVVKDEWGAPVDVTAVEEMLASHPEARALAFVHAETSTGVESDAAALCRVAAEHGALSIVDTVTSLGGTPVEVDGWGADAVYAGSQKCLSCTPGLSPVTFSDRAMAAVEARTTPVQSWFLDLTLVTGYWGGGKRAYHHTAPINPLYALHEALLILQEEGLENAWARHRRMHEALKAGVKAMGLGFFVAEEYRLPQLNAVTVPGDVDGAAVRAALLEHFNLEIGAGLGPMAGRIWRIGLMGHSASPTNVLLCLTALDAVLGGMGADIDRGAAVPAAMEALGA
ncbi:MAG: pyridoxal-phosphate-dependent aminotransferase family protein [Candidatus Longimicrobiales bacterium M2_2A_002]